MYKTISQHELQFVKAKTKRIQRDGKRLDVIKPLNLI